MLRAWEALTRRRLFKKRTDPGTMTAVLSQDVPPPSKLAEDVPPELDRIVLRALDRDPCKRYATAREFGKDLGRFISGCGVPMGAPEIAEILTEMMPAERERTRALISGARSLPSATQATPTPTLVGASRRGPLAVGMVALGLAVGIGGYFAVRTEPAEQPSTESSRQAGEEHEEASGSRGADAVPSASPASTTHTEEQAEVAPPQSVAARSHRPVRSMNSMNSMRAMRSMRSTPPAMSETESNSVVEAGGSGELRVVTPGAWARVTVDGEDHGPTPVRLTLPTGRHRVVLHWPNGSVEETTVRLTPDGFRLRRVPP